jgi:hypothetical protein
MKNEKIIYVITFERGSYMLDVFGITIHNNNGDIIRLFWNILASMIIL